MKIPYADLAPMHDEIYSDLVQAFTDVLDSGWFIQGKQCDAFEQDFAAYLCTDHCIGCGNGLDALTLILRAMEIGPGDEVIIPAHTFIATGLAVSYCGATPVFVDIEPDYYCIDPEQLAKKITPRTKAVIMVHLYGQIGRWEEVAEITNTHGLYLIEDSAQAHGAQYKNGKKAGGLGDAAAFSFYPGKNLGALGDGGAVTTNKESLAKLARAIGNYGCTQKYVHDYKGINSRLDEMQAALLSKKLTHFGRWNEGRRQVAKNYISEIKNGKIKLPKINPDSTHTWHIFPVLVDNPQEFISVLGREGIQTNIHYPTPMHLHSVYQSLCYRKGDFPIAERLASTEVSLPIYYGMTDAQTNTVIHAVNNYI